MMPKAEFQIDGERFSTLRGFFKEFGRVLTPGTKWGRNLDAFDDVLSGGFGTPETGFILRWKSSSRSREVLNRSYHRGGPSTFDLLVEIIRDHGEGGRQAEDGVELILE